MSSLAGLGQLLSLVLTATTIKSVSLMSGELDQDGHGALAAKMLHGLYVTILVHPLSCSWYFSITGLILLAIRRLKNSNEVTPT